MNLKKLILISSVLFVLLFMTYINNNLSNNNKIENTNSLEALKINTVENKISEKQAIKNVKEYLHKTGSYVPPVINVDSVDGNYYLVHAYEIINNEEESHTATTGWFHVNINTGQVIDIMN